jgi:hypothetical protein
LAWQCTERLQEQNSTGTLETVDAEKRLF